MKMCDFGISGYLVDSVAKTMDAGCKPYMAVRSPNPHSWTTWRVLCPSEVAPPPSLPRACPSG